MDQPTFSSFSNSDRTEISGTHLNSSDPGQDSTKRRSSSRSIKRRRFDDELVEYSLGLPGASNIKSSRTRTHSVNSTQVESPLAAGGSSSSGVTGAGASSSVGATASVDNKRRQSGKGVGQSSSRRPKKGRQHSHIATKDLGRWKPTDDLALIIGVQQTNDLRTVHLGTKFSCRFTVQELQQRWYALLYDQAVSRVAVAAMRNLHPEMIAAVQDKALWSTQEEQLLATIKSNSQPGLEQFEELLSKNSEVFYPSRTAKSLQRHWATLRMYHLLPDQSVAPLPNTDHPAVLTFTDAEEAIQDSELNEPVDEALDREIRLAQRRNAHEIRHLENELSRWSVLVDSVTSPSPAPVPGDLDNQTLAVLRGRLVRYLMRSREITIGRCTKVNIVDIDLALEGPAHKISRRQGTLRLRNTGEFYLSSEGKRPIFVDGRPILAGNKVRLYNNSVVEIASLRFIFSVNQEIIRAIHNEAVKMNLPP